MSLLNRFTFHTSTEKQVLKYRLIRRVALSCAKWIVENVPDSHERDMAIDHIDMAVMWCNAAVARHIDLRP